MATKKTQDIDLSIVRYEYGDAAILHTSGGIDPPRPRMCWRCGMPQPSRLEWGRHINQHHGGISASDGAD